MVGGGLQEDNKLLGKQAGSRSVTNMVLGQRKRVLLGTRVCKSHSFQLRQLMKCQRVLKVRDKPAAYLETPADAKLDFAACAAKHLSGWKEATASPCGGHKASPWLSLMSNWWDHQQSKALVSTPGSGRLSCKAEVRVEWCLTGAHHPAVLP